jgi:uncharacterized membrane protein
MKRDLSPAPAEPAAALAAPVAEASPAQAVAATTRVQRFAFVDRFRGLIIILMALDHASYYLNSAWLSLDPLDPFFDSWGQALLRYLPYLCAPGFLLLNGAMVDWTYHKRLRQGMSAGRARWDLAQRGLFLIAFQLTWVNSSWGGFTRLRLDHFGIIACIGTSMLLLLLVVTWPWWSRLLLAAAVMVAHPFLLMIPYDHDGPWHYAMQMFVDAGDFNKYPVLPWFAVALAGSVMARFWFTRWRGTGELARKSALVGAAVMIVALAVRLGRGFGNIFPYGEVGTWSFFYDQKYPPSLFFNLWWLGICLVLVGGLAALGMRTRLLDWLGLTTFGKVALFFYGLHIAVLGVITHRLGLWYLAWGVTGTYLGWLVLLLSLYPLCRWYAGVKLRSRAWLVRMI